MNNFLFTAQEGQLDCLMWLTKYSRLSASEPSHDGMTALHASAQEGHLDCVRYLIQFARCSPTQIDFSGCTPLHFGKNIIYKLRYNLPQEGHVWAQVASDLPPLELFIVLSDELVSRDIRI